MDAQAPARPSMFVTNAILAFIALGIGLLVYFEGDKRVAQTSLAEALQCIDDAYSSPDQAKRKESAEKAVAICKSNRQKWASHGLVYIPAGLLTSAGEASPADVKTIRELLSRQQ